MGEDFGSEAPFGLLLPDRSAAPDAVLGGGGAILGAEGEMAGAAFDAVEGRSVGNDGLSWGAGEGAMATAALIVAGY